MKIGIDIRNLSNNKKDFLSDFINFFISQNKEDNLNIYANKFLEIENPNLNKKSYNFITSQLFFLRQLIKDKNDVVLTFEETFPIFYKGRTIQIVSSLENILYPDLENTKFIKKYSLLFTIKKNLNNANKIICFSEKTKKELNEKLNIIEDKILIINPFFPSSNELTSQINVKTKLGLIGDYLVYDYNFNNSNLKKVLESIKELNKNININLVILGNKNANNRDIREIILNLGIAKKIFFAGNPISGELGLYYKQSRGVIYPIIYDNFPITLNNAINFETPIIASDNTEIKNIFGNKISYFSPISVISIVDNINKFLKKDSKNINYDFIKKEYNKENFYSNLISVIK